MLRESLNEIKSEKFPLQALPSMLRNLSQLGRSGVLRCSYENHVIFFQLNEGIIERLLIQDSQLVKYVVERLEKANLVKSNIAELVSSSKMRIGEFSTYLISEGFCSEVGVFALLEGFAREILFLILDSKEGSIDFNLRTEVLNEVENSTYALMLNLSPGQLFLDYWDSIEQVRTLEMEGCYFISGNASRFDPIYSPIESKIIHFAENGAYLEALMGSVFEVKDQTVETLLRLAKSGILISEIPTKIDVSVADSVEAEAPIVEEAVVSKAMQKEAEIDLLERCLPVVVIALILKFVIEFRAIIYLVEHAFAN